MMAQWTLLSVAILVAGGAVADILVQPGYEQPQPMLQTQPRMQSEGLQHRESLSGYAQHQPPVLMYHPKHHPMYANVQPQMSYMPKAYDPQLASQMRTLGLDGTPGVVPTHYLPMAVHNRNRRSSDDKPDSRTGRGDKHEEADVAAKSTLNEHVPPVVDLQSQNREATENLDEKRAEVRQSRTVQPSRGTLLGLNPLNMYPGIPQQYPVGTIPGIPVYNGHLQMTGPLMQQPSLMSPRNVETVALQQTPTQNQATISTQNDAANQQRHSSDYISNYDTLQAPTNDEPKVRLTSRSSVNAKNSVASNDKELVGTKLQKYTEPTNRLHATFGVPNYATSGNYPCSCTNPGYVVQNVNDAMSNNLAMQQTGAQQMQYVYQVPSVLGTNYLSNARYVVVPQAYNNYPTSYNWGYQSTPTPFTVCLQNSDTTPSVAYHLA
ncbi:uncharacterized protein LOC143342503 [Colletes latitarsis]|uniref:uncharacterized protein LOC143342503 n=1 Tax=Colletes latitarsis TaxID=2605962 RepID=UPI0040367319